MPDIPIDEQDREVLERLQQARHHDPFSWLGRHPLGAETIAAWEQRIDTAAEATSAPDLAPGRGGLPPCDHPDVQSLRELVLYGLKR